MIVLGIDPGTAATGYGIVERNGSKLRLIDYGCLETVPADELPVRLLHIHQAVSRAHRRPQAGARRRRAALLQQERADRVRRRPGEGRGPARGRAGRPAGHEYGPHEVKIAVTGYGRADKEQVQRMVQAVLGMAVLPRPDDAADALAVAICLAHTERPAA